jgi:hypothetical protein
VSKLTDRGQAIRRTRHSIPVSTKVGFLTSEATKAAVSYRAITPIGWSTGSGSTQSLPDAF